MTKLSSKEFIEKYTAGDKKITENEDLLLEMMEDADDSIKSDNQAEIDTLKSEIESLKADNADLKERYKNRFLMADEKPEKPPVIEEPEERKVIDIKEI